MPKKHQKIFKKILKKPLTLSNDFAIIGNVPSEQKHLREWRNRQTRTFEGRVVIPYGFKSRLSHQRGFLQRNPLFNSRFSEKFCLGGLHRVKINKQRNKLKNKFATEK